MRSALLIYCGLRITSLRTLALSDFRFTGNGRCVLFVPAERTKGDRALEHDLNPEVTCAPSPSYRAPPPVAAGIERSVPVSGRGWPRPLQDGHVKSDLRGIAQAGGARDERPPVPARDRQDRGRTRSRRLSLGLAGSRPYQPRHHHGALSRHRIEGGRAPSRSAAHRSQRQGNLSHGDRKRTSRKGKK